MSNQPNILKEILKIQAALKKNKTCFVTSLPLTGCNGQSVIFDNKIYFWDGDSWVTYTTSGLSTSLIVVNTYSNLPDPTTVNGKFYFVENNQGTKWLPGSLGGTFYAKGLYYSNGVDWIYGGEFPINASQIETDAGFLVDKFISPNTLANYFKWNTKQNNIQFKEEGANLGTSGDVDTINFIGSSVTASRTGNTIDVTISGGSGTGTTVKKQYIAGEDINGGKAVMIDTDGRVYAMDITNTYHYQRYLGIAEHAVVTNDLLYVVTHGEANTLGSSWVAGEPYYISSTGFLSNTPPTVGNCRQVGVGVDSDHINIGTFSNYILT